GAMSALETYASKYETVRMERQDGILQVTLHTHGGPLLWGEVPHRELGYAFADIAADPENRVVLLTGAGDSFWASLGGGANDVSTPRGWDKIYGEGKRLLLNLLDIEVPMIAAVNGPATIHAELALLCDIVLASDAAYFQDAAHFPNSVVPGDGVH